MQQVLPRGRAGAISSALAMALCVASTCGASYAKPSPKAERGMSDAEVRARADALIAQMTPEEKAGQLITLFALPIPQMQQAVEKQAAQGSLGSVLFATDPAAINRFQKAAIEKSRLKIPLLFGFDVVHGLSTIFPVPIGLSASWDPDLIQRSQSFAAAEARAVGLHWTFAPMIDVARDPRWGRIVEGPGEDPYLASAIAAAQVRGFQGAYLGAPGHIIAGPKHFAAYGAAEGGRDYDEVDVSESALRNVYFPPFKAAIDAGAGNIMSAYMGLNGIPATSNKWLLTDVLRGEWGFKGWVVSDNEAVKNLRTHGLADNAADAAAGALKAGADMEMAVFGPAFSTLPASLKSGKVEQRELDDAVRRVLETKIRMGLFEKPYVDEAAAAKRLKDPEALKAARIAAERSAVLLRNEGALLPLDRRKIRTIAVSGPLANAARDALGPWVFDQNKPIASSILDGIKSKGGPGVSVSYTPGVVLPERLVPSPFAQIVGTVKRDAPSGDDDAGIAEAVAAAQKADVAVVVVGEAQDMIGESASRASLDLPGRQQDLLDAVVATGKPVVVVLMNGRPLDLKQTKASAILDVWYPGSAAGAAAGNLLFGDAVPGGKLPFTWPRSVGQVPIFYSRLASHDPAGAEKRYWDESGAPAFPFGHGLSYSTFAYSNLRVSPAVVAPNESVTVTVDLKNTGQRAADEVAQLYLHQRVGTAARPVRELKGFQRVTLKPGETRTLTFRIGQDEMRYWNAATRSWTVDETKFDVAVGGDSTAKFGSTFEVKR